MVRSTGLLGPQQLQPAGCLRLLAYSSTVCGAWRARSLVSWARRWLPGKVARPGALRITRALWVSQYGQAQGSSRSAIGRSTVKSPHCGQSYS